MAQRSIALTLSFILLGFMVQNSVCQSCPNGYYYYPNGQNEDNENDSPCYAIGTQYGSCLQASYQGYNLQCTQCAPGFSLNTYYYASCIPATSIPVTIPTATPTPVTIPTAIPTPVVTPTPTPTPVPTGNNCPTGYYYYPNGQNEDNENDSPCYAIGTQYGSCLQASYQGYNLQCTQCAPGYTLNTYYYASCIPATSTPVIIPTPTPTPVVIPTPTPTPVVNPTPTPTPVPTGNNCPTGYYYYPNGQNEDNENDSPCYAIGTQYGSCLQASYQGYNLQCTQCAPGYTLNTYYYASCIPATSTPVIIPTPTPTPVVIPTPTPVVIPTPKPTPVVIPTPTPTVPVHVVACPSGEILLASGKCAANCPTGFVAAPNHTVCLSCPPNCAYCVSGFVCTACNSGWLLLSHGYVTHINGYSCVQNCPTGYSLGFYTNPNNGSQVYCSDGSDACIENGTNNIPPNVAYNASGSTSNYIITGAPTMLSEKRSALSDRVHKRSALKQE
jgi:hypothetical protein